MDSHVAFQPDDHNRIGHASKQRFFEVGLLTPHVGQLHQRHRVHCVGDARKLLDQIWFRVQQIPAAWCGVLKKTDITLQLLVYVTSFFPTRLSKGEWKLFILE